MFPGLWEQNKTGGLKKFLIFLLKIEISNNNSKVKLFVVYCLLIVVHSVVLSSDLLSDNRTKLVI